MAAMTKTTKPLPCYKCGSKVALYIHEGGRGSGNASQYSVDCDHCEVLEQFLGKDTGKLSVAIREWNDLCRRKAKGK